MDGRQWYEGPVGLHLILYGPNQMMGLLRYLSGIMDTLDGSHGLTFTYLPIAYQDDAQVASMEGRFVERPEVGYELTIQFL